MNKLLKILMIPVIAIGLVSCGNITPSSGGTNTPVATTMKDYFNDEIILQDAIGKNSNTSLHQESYALDDLMSMTPKIAKKCYMGSALIRADETIYVSNVSFKIQSDFEFYLDLNLCDSEANWAYNENLYHIVPNEEITLSFDYDNFKVKRMRELMLFIYPSDEKGKALTVTEENQVNEWIYTIYALNITVVTDK